MVSSSGFPRIFGEFPFVWDLSVPTRSRRPRIRERLVTNQGDVQSLKQRVQAEVDRLTPDLLATSRFLHANPELAYEERKAAKAMTAVDLLVEPPTLSRVSAEFRGRPSI